jgi:mannose-6-phosphate isomerase-like protein (cupin superfamily)
MSQIAPASTPVRAWPPVLVRAGEAEQLPAIGHVLLADAPATGGALSSHRIALAPGDSGAVPHRHDGSCELFYILGGALDVLAGTDVVTAGEGDLLVVPPGTAHAFGPHRGCGAEALVIITPGIERFGYFRHLVSIRQGAESRQLLAGLQGTYDTHFVDSPAWTRAHRSATAASGPQSAAAAQQQEEER